MPPPTKARITISKIAPTMINSTVPTSIDTS
jgi:hypothetical protein